jgi:hypothetical protein
MLIVRRRPDQVEPNAIEPPMRRTLKAGHEPAVEYLARYSPHRRR